MNKIIFYSIAFSLFLASNANALQCFSPLSSLIPPEVSDTLKKQIRLKALVELITPDKSDSFIVFGNFSPISKLPFTHLIETESRWNRRYNNEKRSEIFPDHIQYTYRNAIKFDGVRVTKDGLEEFHTDQTNLIVTQQDEWLGHVPDFETTTIGKISPNEAEKDRFDIHARLCPTFHEISNEELQKALACLHNKSTCPLIK